MLTSNAFILRRLMVNKLPMKSIHIVQFNTVKLFKFSFLHFKLSLKILAAPLFTYNVLLFNFFSLSCTDIWVILDAAVYSALSTTEGLNSKGNYSNLKVISKGNYSKYFKNLRNAVSVLEMSRWVGVASAILPNINSSQVDIDIYSVVTCHV